ncbi:MAG: dienelactone hydrolase family protein [Frankiales bacterium]|nr:dienelactone hydrolase family protein [Frankiales bacterium]
MTVELPTTDKYTDVQESAVELTSRYAGTVPALVFRPTGDGPYPAVVIGVEAYGINDFGRRVAASLAHRGYVVVVPDYYRGHGLKDPENYLDFTEVMGAIDGLDFTAGAHDQLAAIDYAAGLDYVDADRIAVWGYCTGGTLSLLAAELSDRIAAAVLFFPSQPTFPELNRSRPVNAIDLLWAIRCPVLVIYGDQDDIMPAAGIADLRERFTRWGVDHEIRVYAGAGHAFSAPVAPLRNDAADRLAWPDAVGFLDSHLAR